MPNLFDLIAAMPRQSRITLALWICRGVRPSVKEWCFIMKCSQTTYHKRKKA